MVLQKILFKMKGKILFLKARSNLRDPSPPMAFGYLGKIAKDQGFEVLVENLNAQYNNKTAKNIIELIKKEKPTIVGIHMFTQIAIESYQLIKEIRPFCKLIIAGGPHPTVRPKEVLEKQVDVVFIGEAEISFKQFLDAVSKNKGFKKVDGIMFKEKNKFIRTKEPKIVDLDEMVIIDREVHRKSDYVKTFEEINNFGQILSSRGCPGRCTYCFKSLFGSCFRFRKARNVFKEIKYLHEKYGINFINFIDDALTVNKKRLIELCDLLIKSDMGISWGCTTRVDFLDQELIFKMKEAGCKMIIIGVESNVPRTLIKTRKTGNPQWYVKQTDNLLKWCKEAGVRAGVNILTGFPWEKPEDIKLVKKYVTRIEPYVTQGFGGGILQPMPNTEDYDENAKKYGFEDYWLHKKPVFKDNYRPFFALYYYYYWDHLQNNFFKFDKKMFNAIDDLYKMMGRWQLFVITKRRFNNPIIARIVFFGILTLSNVSLFLYKFSPNLEKKLLEKIKNFSYRFKFRKKTDNLK